MSVALKDVLTPDPKPVTKAGRFLLLYFVKSTPAESLLFMFMSLPHTGLPFGTHPPHSCQMSYGQNDLPQLRSCSHEKESMQHVNKNL